MTLLDVLKKAITTRLLGATNDFKTAIADQFFYVENPNDFEDLVYPYGVYQFISGTLERDTATVFDEMIVQFTFYDDSMSSGITSALIDKLDGRFERCESSLSLSGYYTLGVDRISEPRETRTWLGDKVSVWQSSVDYRIRLQKT